MSGQEKSEVLFRHRGNLAIADRYAVEIAPDFGGRQRKRQMGATEGPVQVDDDLAVDTMKGILTLAVQECSSERAVALGATVAERRDKGPVPAGLRSALCRRRA